MDLNTFMLSSQVQAVTFTTARGREKLVFVAPEPTEHGAVPVHRSQNTKQVVIHRHTAPGRRDETERVPIVTSNKPSRC